MKKEDNRYYLVDNNKITAEVCFKIDNNVCDIYHTYVDPNYRGNGLAKILLDELLSDLEKKNIEAKATCSYASSYLEKRNYVYNK